MSRLRITAVAVVLLGAWWLSANPPAQQLAYGPGFSTEQALLRDILFELKGMRQDMRALAGGGQASPLTVGDHRAIIKARCARCHSEAVAENEGGGFAMLGTKGDVPEFSGLERRHIGNKVRANQMPPGGGLSEAEKRVLENIPVRGGKQ